jgi:FSR family fosmidomycin resistance protein-like MFS transporter
MALVAIAPDYWTVLAAVVFSGLGVASYHPEAFNLVLASVGERKVIAIFCFMVGDNLGKGPLGSVLISTAVGAWLRLPGEAVRSAHD